MDEDKCMVHQRMRCPCYPLFINALFIYSNVMMHFAMGSQLFDALIVSKFYFLNFINQSFSFLYSVSIFISSFLNKRAYVKFAGRSI